MWDDRAPVNAVGPAFRRDVIVGDSLFSQGNRHCGRGFFFKEGFGLDGREILSMDSYLNESTSSW